MFKVFWNFFESEIGLRPVRLFFGKRTTRIHELHYIAEWTSTYVRMYARTSCSCVHCGRWSLENRVIHRELCFAYIRRYNGSFIYRFVSFSRIYTFCICNERKYWRNEDKIGSLSRCSFRKIQQQGSRPIHGHFEAFDVHRSRLIPESKRIKVLVIEHRDRLSFLNRCEIFHNVEGSLAIVLLPWYGTVFSLAFRVSKRTLPHDRF